MIIQEQDNTGNNSKNKKSFFDDPEKILGDAQPTQQPRTAQDILQSIYSIEAPRPTYDPNRPEEIKRIAKLNAIGEGLKSIGDMVALGKGANVTRREPDRTNPQMLSALWQNVDKANAQQDNWNWQNYLSKIRNANAELGQVNHDNTVARQEKNRAEDISRQETWRDEDQQYRDERNNIVDSRYDQNFEREKAWREGGGELNQWKDKTKFQFGLDMEKLDKRLSAEMAKYAAKANFNGKNFILFDDGGQPVKTLAPGELEKITQIILKDPQVSASATKDIGLMKAQFGEGLSKQALQTIIAYYWDKSPAVLEYLKGAQQEQKSTSGLSPQGQAEQDSAVQQNAAKLPGLGNQNTPFKFPGLGK